MIQNEFPMMEGGSVMFGVEARKTFYVHVYWLETIITLGKVRFIARKQLYYFLFMCASEDARACVYACVLHNNNFPLTVMCLYTESASSSSGEPS